MQVCSVCKISRIILRPDNRSAFRHSTQARKESHYAHFVLYFLLAVLAGFVGDDDVEVAVVLGVGGAVERAFDGLALVDGDGVGSVEHCLSAMQAKL